MATEGTGGRCVHLGMPEKRAMAAGGKRHMDMCILQTILGGRDLRPPAFVRTPHVHGAETRSITFAIWPFFSHESHMIQSVDGIN